MHPCTRPRCLRRRAARPRTPFRRAIRSRADGAAAELAEPACGRPRGATPRSSRRPGLPHRLAAEDARESGVSTATAKRCALLAPERNNTANRDGGPPRAHRDQLGKPRWCAPVLRWRLASWPRRRPGPGSRAAVGGALQRIQPHPAALPHHHGTPAAAGGWHERKAGLLNQRIAVVPAPGGAWALKRPGTRRLTVSVAGYFPDAADHRVDRPNGVPETVVIVCTGGTDGHASAAPHTGSGRGPRSSSRTGCCTRTARARITLDDLVATPAGHRRRRARRVDGGLGAQADGAGTVLERGVALLEEIVPGLERDQSPVRLLGTSGAAWKLPTQISADRVYPEAGDPLERAMSYLAERLDGSVSRRSSPASAGSRRPAAAPCSARRPAAGSSPTTPSCG